MTELVQLAKKNIRIHRRLVSQSIVNEAVVNEAVGAKDSDRGILDSYLDKLPSLPPLTGPFTHGIAILDWDHKLPSKRLLLRVLGYYTKKEYTLALDELERRKKEQDYRDKYPEFDIADYENVPASEAYECEFDLSGEFVSARLTSVWRRNIPSGIADMAENLVKTSPEFERDQKLIKNRPNHFGGLESVSWVPPCESGLPMWCVDTWFLLAFDGHTGSGLSYLVDPNSKQVALARDFSVGA